MAQSDEFVRDLVSIKFKSNLCPTKLSNEALFMLKSVDTQTSSNTVIVFLIIWLSFLGHWSKLDTVYNGGVRETYNKYIVL